MCFCSAWIKIPILLQKSRTIKRVCLNLSWSVNFRSLIRNTSFYSCYATILAFLACFHSIQEMLIQITLSLLIVLKLRSFVRNLSILLTIFLRFCMRSFIAMAHLTTNSARIRYYNCKILIFMLHCFKSSVWGRYFIWLGIIKLYWGLFLHVILLWIVRVSC